MLGFLERAGGAISLFAVAIIVVGFVLASGRYVLRWRDVTLDRNFNQFKVELGRALTLGLEILVLADVIETITVKPTYQSLAVLGLLVVVRTIVSWTLSLETEGHWPWQASAGDEENG
ncbi:DUF1622 domain-containing protein [bacterium]|nr:DUF1622 domain-containing protein [bacterium]